MLGIPSSISEIPPFGRFPDSNVIRTSPNFLTFQFEGISPYSDGLNEISSL